MRIALLQLRGSASHRMVFWYLMAIILGVAAASPLSAQQEASRSDTALALELNRLDPSEQGCRATFVMKNRLGTDVEALAFELALFDRDGAVTSLIALEAGSLPDERTRVKRFALGGIDCENVERVLLNDITQCDGDGLYPLLCAKRLELSSRVDPNFIR